MPISILQEKSKVVVTIEWVIFVLEIIGFVAAIILGVVIYDWIVDWVSGLAEDQIKRNGEQVDEKAIVDGVYQGFKIVLITFGVIGLISICIQFLIIRTLSKGVNTKNQHKIKIWWILNAVGFMFGILAFIFVIYQVANGVNVGIYALVTNLCGLVYRAVTLKILKDYMDELQNEATTVVQHSAPVNEDHKV